MMSISQGVTTVSKELGGKRCTQRVAQNEVENRRSRPQAQTQRAQHGIVL